MQTEPVEARLRRAVRRRRFRRRDGRRRGRIAGRRGRRGGYRTATAAATPLSFIRIKHPGVVIWPDAFGLRPSMRDMGRQLRGRGYAVRTATRSIASAERRCSSASNVDFQDTSDPRPARPADGLRQRRRCGQKDAAAYVAFLDAQPQVDRIAQIGPRLLHGRRAGRSGPRRRCRSGSAPAPRSTAAGSSPTSPTARTCSRRASAAGCLRRRGQRRPAPAGCEGRARRRSRPRRCRPRSRCYRPGTADLRARHADRRRHPDLRRPRGRAPGRSSGPLQGRAGLIEYAGTSRPVSTEPRSSRATSVAASRSGPPRRAGGRPGGLAAGAGLPPPSAHGPGHASAPDGPGPTAPGRLQQTRVDSGRTREHRHRGRDHASSARDAIQPSTLLMFALLSSSFSLLLIQRQQRGARKARRARRRRLEVGDDVRDHRRIYGTITAIDDEEGTVTGVQVARPGWSTACCARASDVWSWMRTPTTRTTTTTRTRTRSRLKKPSVTISRRSTRPTRTESKSVVNIPDEPRHPRPTQQPRNQGTELPGAKTRVPRSVPSFGVGRVFNTGCSILLACRVPRTSQSLACAGL